LHEEDLSLTVAVGDFSVNVVDKVTLEDAPGWDYEYSDDRLSVTNSVASHLTNSVSQRKTDALVGGSGAGERYVLKGFGVNNHAGYIHKRSSLYRVLPYNIVHSWKVIVC
jgi:hypothetical protein